MLKSSKVIFFAITGLIGLIILISVIFLFAGASIYKSRLERAASEALGMEVHIGGRLGIAFFPDLRVRLDDMRIRNQGMDIASAKEASLKIALLPLLHKEVRIMRIGLKSPSISVKRYRDGTFTFEKAKGTFPAPGLENLSLTDGVFLYRDEQSGEEFEVGNFNLDVHSLRIAGENGTELLKWLLISIFISCRQPGKLPRSIMMKN